MYGLYAGGLVGDNEGTVYSSHADVALLASRGGTAGGAAAENSGTIMLSSAAGTVVAEPDVKAADGDEYVGGLAGKNDGEIDRSFSTAAVDGGSGKEDEGRNTATHAGGLVGINSRRIVNSYARGSVTIRSGGVTFSSLGGFIGADTSGGQVVDLTYSTGAVNCTCEDHDRIGGYIGSSGNGSIKISRSYWDVETSGRTAGCGDGLDCSGIEGRTTSELTSALPHGFSRTKWHQAPDINDGYPYLKDNPPPQ